MTASYLRRFRQPPPPPELVCEYCLEPIEPRICQDGWPYEVQPRACSPAHRERLAAWDRWIAQGRDVRRTRPAPRLPSMPKAELIEPYREEVAA